MALRTEQLYSYPNCLVYVTTRTTRPGYVTGVVVRMGDRDDASTDMQLAQTREYQSTVASLAYGAARKRAIAEGWIEP